jgi:hypothetical protein
MAKSANIMAFFIVFIARNFLFAWGAWGVVEGIAEG